MLLDWLNACCWVCREAQAEQDVGRPGQFCELATTMVEEAEGGAMPEELLVFVWAVVGEPPEMAAAMLSGEDGAARGADEAAAGAEATAEAEAAAEAGVVAVEAAAVEAAEEAAMEAEAEAKAVAEAKAKAVAVKVAEVEAAVAAAGAVAEAEAVAMVEAVAAAEAEAVVAATAEAEERWRLRRRLRRGEVAAEAEAMTGSAAEAEAEAGAEVGLAWPRQGQDQGGTLRPALLRRAAADAARTPATREDGVRTATVGRTASASGLAKWRERKRIFDPGGILVA
eukprot:SAG11_NODE_36_length_21869_cov_38.038999_7_plen_283_part_00